MAKLSSLQDLGELCTIEVMAKEIGTDVSRIRDFLFEHSEIYRQKVTEYQTKWYWDKDEPDTIEVEVAVLVRVKDIKRIHLDSDGNLSWNKEGVAA